MSKTELEDTIERCLDFALKQDEMQSYSMQVIYITL